MILTAENYYSSEANMEYMSASQYKSFLECEAGTMARINGEYEEEKSTALLIGSFVDNHFSKTLDLFKAQNPDIFLKGKPELKSEYKHAEYIIARIERDTMFMKYISGEQQVIKTGEIEGVPFKTRIDSYHPGKAIVDLKVMRDFEPVWKAGLKLTFIEAWGYDIQGAIYQAIEGNNLPFFIAAATKEKPEPDIALISIPQDRLDYCLNQVKGNVQRFADIKKGLIEPVRCEKCPWCRSTKVLTQIVDYLSIA
jgi:hypothetical protein